MTRPEPAFTPDAHADALQAFEYYNAQSPNLGFEFLDELEDTASIIHETPLIFTTVALRASGDPLLLSRSIREAIWRVDQVAPEGRYTLDNASKIAEIKDRAVAEAREQLPLLRGDFFREPAPLFTPYHSLKCQSQT